MRRKDVGNDLMQDNETYRKAKPNDAGEKSPRENPSQQSADKQGYGRPEFERWTTEELIELARTLEISDPEQMARASLIDTLVERELR